MKSIELQPDEYLGEDEVLYRILEHDRRRELECVAGASDAAPYLSLGVWHLIASG